MRDRVLVAEDGEKGRVMRFFGPAVSLALAASLPWTVPAFGGAAAAQVYTEAGFRAYLPELRAKAVADGITRQTVDNVFSNLTFSTRTVELDRAQPGGSAGSSAIPAFAPYRERHVNPALISRGRDRYAANIGQLSAIGRRYGVTPSVLVAIWGHETSYGAVTGDFDLLNSLATLAYEGRRRDLFADEFVATM